MSRLGSCQRCLGPRPRKAVTVERLAFGDSAYEVTLCDGCADRFQQDMFSWARYGRLVEEVGARRPRVHATTERGVILASHVHVPVMEAPIPEPRPTPRAPHRDTREPWSFSKHALDRHRARGVSRADALRAAQTPEIIRPSDTIPHAAIHICGHVKVVVDPRLRRIITVANTTEQEPGHAASH
jgi:hypothetical protein